MIYIVDYTRLVYFPYQKKNEIPTLNTLNTKEKQKSFLKETVGIEVSNLKAENPTWSLGQLSILNKIKIGTKLIKK